MRGPHHITLDDKTFLGSDCTLICPDEQGETMWRLPRRAVRLTFHMNRGRGSLAISNGTRVTFMVNGPAARVRDLYDMMRKG